MEKKKGFFYKVKVWFNGLGESGNSVVPTTLRRVGKFFILICWTPILFTANYSYLMGIRAFPLLLVLYSIWILVLFVIGCVFIMASRLLIAVERKVEVKEIEKVIH